LFIWDAAARSKITNKTMTRMAVKGANLSVWGIFVQNESEQKTKSPRL
jgi:hypothetical protein